ncbi:MAG: carboxymuconolactone decarboxylase family protein [Acidimicrobiales bacterium]
MARVKLIDPAQAEGRAHEVFERVKGYYKMVPGLQQGLNYLPETTDALWTLSLNTAMEGTIREELKRVFFAVTAYEVECEYCTAAHMLALMGKEWSRDECVDLIEGKPSPRLSDKENAAVDFARIVGRRPAAVTDDMTEKLREQGWTDAEIVEIVAAVALMRYTTTVASALDVPLEEAMEGVGVSCGVPLDRLNG